MKKKRHEILEAKRLKAFISDTSTNSLIIYDPHSQTTQDLSITTWADYNQHD